MKKLLCLILAAVLIAVPFTAMAGEGGETFTLRVSTTRGDMTWFAQMYDDIFAELTEASGGRLQFEVFHNNTLGAPADIWNMFTTGGIDILDMSPGMVGSFPVSEGFNVPFLYENDTQVLVSMNNLLAAGLLPEYTDNMQVLSFLPGGNLELFTTKVKVNTMDDLKGLKLRASSVTLSKAIEALGGTAVSIQPSEQTTALQQGVLDGVITGALFGSTTGLGEVCPFLMQGTIGMSCMFCGMNKATWEKLPADLQTLITDTFTAKVNEFYMPKLQEEYEKSIEVLKGQGVDVYPTDEALLAAMKEATASFKTEYVEGLKAQGLDGDAIIAIIDDAIANN
ncbi:MAG: TRAP transporter substrate-binding protein DctP [Parasporobacterium sp.]|nr:TRAP transporter substrate-binding protein DctP [Parasporobacterium sp.]